jgi:hypothetical protein
MSINDESSLDVYHYEAGTFLDTLFGDVTHEERIEIRYKLPGGNYPMRRKFLDNQQQVLEESIKLAGTHDVYLGVALRLGESGTKDGVSRLLALHADLDIKGEYTAESRRRQLQDLPHPPSMRVCSGGGWHLYWLLERPAVDERDLGRCEQAMRGLAEKLNGDPVHDRSRILRVPGTFNHKLDTPRPVSLVEHHPDRRYTLDQLEEMTGTAQEVKGKGSVQNSVVPREILSSPIEDGQRNFSLASVAGSLRDRGLDRETIDAVLQEVNRRRCSPALPEGEVSAIARSISRYDSGSPRYKKSTARRNHRKKERD